MQAAKDASACCCCTLSQPLLSLLHSTLLSVMHFHTLVIRHRVCTRLCACLTPGLILLLYHLRCFRLAVVHTRIVVNATGSSEAVVQHVNLEGETVATAGDEGDGGGPDIVGAPANVGTCDPKYWSCPGAAGYRVRGQTYLKVTGNASQYKRGSLHLLVTRCPTGRGKHKASLM